LFSLRSTGSSVGYRAASAENLHLVARRRRRRAAPRGAGDRPPQPRIRPVFRSLGGALGIRADGEFWAFPGHHRATVGYRYHGADPVVAAGHAFAREDGDARISRPRWKRAG